MRTACLTLALGLFCAIPVSAQERVDYVKHVKPILTRHCAECHNDKQQKGGLRLDTAAALLQGGDSGSAVVPGQAGKSLLIEVLGTASPYPRMPYKRSPLSDKEIGLLK